MTDYTRLHKQLSGRVDGDPQIAHRTGLVDKVNLDGTLDVTVGGVTLPGVHQVQVGVGVGDPVQLVVWRGGLLALSADCDCGTVGEWTTWTPTLTNMPNTTAQLAQYMRIGNTVWFRLHLHFSGAGGSGTYAFTLPVAMQYSIGWQLFGQGIMLQASVSRRSCGVAWNQDIGQAQFLISGYGATVSFAGQTTPFVWGNSDSITAQGWYRCQP